MLLNYLKIAIRNFIRYKIFSVINVLGLAIGIACCILIVAWVLDELSFDRFHESSENLYRIMTEAHYTDKTNQFAATPAPLGPALKEDFPEIEASARMAYSGESLVKYGDNSFYENRLRFVDPDFLKIFTFPLINGDIQSVLSDPYSVVITEEMAAKYFGEENPVGKYLTLDNDDFKVTGVVQNVPVQSHIEFDFLLPFDLLVLSGGRVHWGGHSYRTYLLLKPGTPYLDLNQKLPDWTSEHTVEPVTYYLQPISDIHLYYEGGIVYVYIFSAIALFVLLIAVINFINKSTAKSSTRAMEVGLRKVIGARRIDIVKQFLSEYFVLALLASIIALILVEVSMPGFNRLAGKNLDFSLFSKSYYLLVLIGITIFTGVLSASYPSLFISSFLPVKILKGAQETGQGKAKLRKVLVIGQFTLSIILINSTIIVQKQLQYIRNRNLGYNKDLMVCIPVRGDVQQKYSAFKNELLKNPGIQDVSAGSGMPGGLADGEWGQIDWEGKNPEDKIRMLHYSVDYNFLDVFGMELREGRNFSNEISSDTMNFILNETAAKAIGIDSPIGTQFTLLWRTGSIIGIVKDFNTSSLRSEILPVIVRMMPPDKWRYVFVKLDSDNPQPLASLEYIKDTWNSFVSDYPFEFEFLDDKVDARYNSEVRLGKIFGIFSILAIIIACLGLFGLASFSTERRRKEIGIRKVLGATVHSLVSLLSREFILLVGIASVVASLTAYFAMDKWLQNFAYRIEISAYVFLLAGSIAIVIALLTVSYQAVRAAVADPVKSLRYE